MKTKSILIPITHFMFLDSHYAKSFRFACSIDLITRNCDMEQIKSIVGLTCSNKAIKIESLIKTTNQRIVRHFATLSKNDPELFDINSIKDFSYKTLYPVTFFEEQLKKISGQNKLMKLIDLFLEKIKEHKQIALNNLLTITTCAERSVNKKTLYTGSIDLKDNAFNRPYSSSDIGFFCPPPEKKRLLINKDTLHKIDSTKSNINYDNVVSMTKDELKIAKAQRRNQLLLDKITPCSSEDTVMKGNKRMLGSIPRSSDTIDFVNQSTLEKQGINNNAPIHETVLDIFYKDVTRCDNEENSNNSFSYENEISLNTEEPLDDNSYNAYDISEFIVNEEDLFGLFS